MSRIVAILLGLLWLASPAHAAQGPQPNSAERDYEIRYSAGPKSDPLEAPILTIVHKGGNRVEKVSLSNMIQSIDEVRYAGSRCIILASLNSSGSRGLDIVDTTTAEIVASAWCFFPVVSPSDNCVAFEKWYPRFTPRDQIWPAVYILSAKDAEAGPVQVYPDEEANPGDPLADNHLVVSPKVWSAKGDVLAFLDQFGDHGNWKAPYEIYAVVVRFKDGKPLRAKRALVQKESFVRPDAHPEYIAFGAESLEIADGKLRGKLHPEEYWVRDTFSFDLAQIDEEQPLNIDGIKDNAVAEGKK